MTEEGTRPTLDELLADLSKTVHAPSSDRSSDGYGTINVSATKRSTEPISPTKNSTPGKEKKIGSNLTELDSLIENLDRARLSSTRSSQNSTVRKVTADGEIQPFMDNSCLEEKSSVIRNPSPGITESVTENFTARTTITRSSAGFSNKATPVSSATQELDQLMALLQEYRTAPTKSSGVDKQASNARQESHASSRIDSKSSTTLQSEMSQPGCCHSCRKPIVGEVITAMGHTWHPEHFTCVHCNKEMRNRSYFERDGKPYCEKDYHQLFSPRCAYCNGPILDKCIAALEKTWHPEHFFCAHCGKSFGEGGYQEKDGKAYCLADYSRLFAPRCGGCDKAILGNYMSALNQQWHPDCFVCKECKKPFEGKTFYTKAGKPICAVCSGVKK